MYSYNFVFYKPGKRFYTQEEAMFLFNKFASFGFESSGKFSLQERVENIDLKLSKSGQELSLFLGPAQEMSNGALGELSIPEEQLKKDSKKNTEILLEAAFVVFSEIKPLFAWGDHELEIRKLEPFLKFDRIGTLAWTNLFSKELIERLGGFGNFFIKPTKEAIKSASQRLEEASFFPIQLSDLPTEPVSPHIALECENRFPGVPLKGFEIPSLGAIERRG